MTFQSVGLSKSSRGISELLLMQLFNEFLFKVKVAGKYIQKRKMQH